VVVVSRDENGGVTVLPEDACSRDDAFDNLDEVIAAVKDDAGRSPTDEELRAAGIDAEDNQRAESGDLPDVLK
jgi:hypothetical protein